ncbi:hypothetical protein [Nocardioides ochotonae]|uniref:hypothetical protein n=1 Tax=Nocardioides ochotonae TaxID=2685869 RepID=UPI00140E84D8|nr:hypothetical protein [Nocardioides ochotonae]
MDHLVRARVGDVELNIGAAQAEIEGFDVLDEPTKNSDGSLRGTTRVGGRPQKEKTSVAKKAAEKKAAVTEPAPTAKGSDQ